MKYTGLSRQKRSRYEFPRLDGGINAHSQDCALSENQLKDAENIWFKEGMLRSRPGIEPPYEAEITRESTLKIRRKLKFTDINTSLSGERCVLAYTLMSDYENYEELRSYFVKNDGGRYNIMPITFTRTSSSEFLKFYNVFFLSGKPTKHSGIYAFLTRRCEEAGYQYEIYELSLELLKWNKLEETDFYIPVTCMYGRGTNYDQAVESGKYVEDKPVQPEGYNMLTGYFKAYYSSDEFSNQFFLPSKDIREDTPVSCRIYYNPYYYIDWVIPANQNSVVVEMFAGKISMHCNRLSGLITFMDEDTMAYPIPRMQNSPKNNIVFTACRAGDAKERVMLHQVAKAYNSRNFLCSNEQYPNEVCSSPISKPLYFAEDMKTSVGKYVSRVVTLGVQQNKLIAFKEDEIYKINVTNKTAYPTGEMYDTSYDFTENERLTTTPIHLEIGCLAPDSVALCGNKLVWMGGGGKIYTLVTTTYGKTNNVYESSAPINKIISRLNSYRLTDAVAAEHDGYYMISVDNSVFLMDYKIRNFGISSTFTGLKDNPDSISWYRWSFPQSMEVTDILRFGGALLVNCKTSTGATYYTARLGGNSDKMHSDHIGSLEEYPVKAFFVTASMPQKSAERLKNVDEVYIESKNNSHLSVEIADKVAPCIYRVDPSDEATVNRITPKIRGIKTTHLKISSKGEFAVGKIIVSYHNISKVR